MGLLDGYKKHEVNFQMKEKEKSSFDYNEFDEKTKENLSELENKALYAKELLTENIKELGNIFLEAQTIFSHNNKNGVFGKWYETLGFKKDFVYLCLSKKKLFLKYENDKIYSLPDRTVKEIKKMEKENYDVIEILDNENPAQKIKEIKKEEKKADKKEITENTIDDNQLNFLGKTKKEVEEDSSTEETSLIKNIMELDKKIMELEIEKEKLKKQLDKLKIKL